MKFKWWGHSCFSITLQKGKTLLTDPYNLEVGYKKIVDEVDIVTISHEHFDHNTVDQLSSNPALVRELGETEVEGIKIKGVSSYHDAQDGKERGENRIFVIDTGEGVICHLGDLGHSLNQKQLNDIGDIDILLVPVGGHYTIDAGQAYDVVQQLAVPVIIPMHYKTGVIDFPIKRVEDFISYFDPEQIVEINDSKQVIDELPEKQQVYLFDYV